LNRVENEAKGLKDETRDKPKSSRVDEIEKALMKECEKSKEYLNRLMYLQADFENYRKRVEKEIYEAAQRTNEKLIVNLLGIIDELEIAIQSGKKTDNMEAVINGVEMVLKKLYVTLEHEGLKKIDALGKPYDPSRHEVVLKTPTSEHEEGTVIEEVRKGFMLKDKVIRPSLVKIALTSHAESKPNPKERE